MDECTGGSSNCHDNATCNNAVGLFECKRKSGFSGNGVVCSGEMLVKCNSGRCKSAVGPRPKRVLDYSEQSKHSRRRQS